jgi:hypothetical protein
MTLKNLTFCTKVPKPRSGTWKRMLDDLKRYGRGGVVEAVYATTLLRGVSICSQQMSRRNIPRMRDIVLAGLHLHLVDLALACQR